MHRRHFTQLALLGAAQPFLSTAAEPLYNESLRPQFHFSAIKGWINDPNGLVYYQGEYHLFFQHNVHDIKPANMAWGHAVSTDMVHWIQRENALEPDSMGAMFSGSAVVDWNNTAGLQQGGAPPIILIYTAAGGASTGSKGQPFTQCLAYSNDRGRTFTKYAGNPVIPNIKGENRDPKVVWHAPTSRWIMALFLDGNTYAFLASPDLKQWTMLHHIDVPHVAECPDFFEMPVANEPGVSKWVWTGANSSYLIGSFDGKRFSPEVMTQPLSQSTANYYAVQTFSGLPANRRVQMSWMNDGHYPGMPFNQQMSCPYELTLNRHNYGSYRLSALPIKEIEALRGTPKSWNNLELKPGGNLLADLTGDLWDISAEIEPGSATQIGFKVRGHAIANTAFPLKPGRFKLRILIDRTSIEAFVNDGDLVVPACFLPEEAAPALELFATGGAAKIVSLDVYPMRSSWRA